MDQVTASEEEILLQLEGLAFDSLQVVSYKWLSRHFLISSNAAKRLLQKFAEHNHKNDLEVVYGVSGWSSKESHTYSIQLVPKSRLEEASAAVQGEPSVHVYSVQRSLSKDPAQLWSTEFTQAETLFNEPSEITNCFRDNRFSAVSCNLAQRSSKKRPRVATSAQPSNSNGAKSSAAPAFSVPKAQPQISAAKMQEPKLNDASAGKKQQPVPTSTKTPSNETEAFSGSASAAKKRPTTVTVGSSTGSSLASMWGKAPLAKPKISAEPVSSERNAVLKSSKTADDAEARIQAMEAADGSEDEDMASEFAGMRRGRQNSSRGRRRMIIDNADDDLDEDDEAHDPERIVRLGSPESPPLPPPKKNGRTVASTQDTLASEHHDGASSAPNVLSSNGKTLSSLQSKTPVKRHGGPEQENNVDGKDGAGGSGPTPSVSEAPRDSSKRKKVYKTTFDSQGREVSVCVWETEEGEGANEDSTKLPTSSRETNAKAPAVRPQPPQKPPAPSKSSTSKAGAKASAKSGGKPAKGQGSITAFFKKT